MGGSESGGMRCARSLRRVIGHDVGPFVAFGQRIRDVLRRAPRFGCHAGLLMFAIRTRCLTPPFHWRTSPSRLLRNAPQALRTELNTGRIVEAV
jgi:hypothetical protein